MIQQDVDCIWKDHDQIDCRNIKCPTYTCCKTIQFYKINSKSESMKNAYILVKSILKDRNLALLNLHNDSKNIRTVANHVISGGEVIDKTN